MDTSLKKILIFGNSGSGKSTIAKELCDSGDLQHLDLDTIAWQDCVPPQRKPLNESAAIISGFVRSCNEWVIEGCYTDLLEKALPYASEIIFMNLPVTACIANAKRRPWEPHKYESKQAQDANLDMLIEWIAHYDTRNDTFSASAHLALYESFSGKKVQYIDNARKSV